MITLSPLNRLGVELAQQEVVNHHYLHRRVDTRCSVEGYKITIDDDPWAGVLLVGRPEATRCGDWYGGVDDVRSGRCQVTRWQVINLNRVWISPKYQPGGSCFSSEYIPGFTDRKGVFRSTLASAVLHQLMDRVGYEYLLRRPPVFLDEPYQIEWLLSYCDLSLHKGTIYKAAGFELYRTNDRGIQTWRIRLPALTAEQHAAIQSASMVSKRARKYRAKRAQMEFQLGEMSV